MNYSFSFFYNFIHNIINFLNINKDEFYIEYFKDTNKSKWNSFIYLLSTPFLFYGYFILIPNILKLNKNNKKKLQMIIYLILIMYYTFINIYYSLLYSIYLFPSLKYAINYNKYSFDRIVSIFYSLIIINIFIYFIYIFGYMITNDSLNNFNNLGNIILDSGFYSMYNLLK